MPMSNERQNTLLANDLAKWQRHVDGRLDKQDAALQEINKKLDKHVQTVKIDMEKVQPVVEAMDSMKTGIKVIGWIGNKVAAIAVVVTAIIGTIIAWKGLPK
jgi:2-oxoglutarate dehydrogenase complex dehydrogenase (E1) component-like enzyme